MIVVDTSAVIAVIYREPDAILYAEALEADAEPAMGAATFVELGVVLYRRYGAEGSGLAQRFIEISGIRLVPFDSQQALLAQDAYARFGVLNFGDAFSYATAKSLGAPLLFKGEDFTKTDIESAL